VLRPFLERCTCFDCRRPDGSSTGLGMAPFEPGSPENLG
jgi:hypothetical protein